MKLDVGSSKYQKARARKLLLLAGGTIILILGFQNCGQGFQAIVNDISESTSESSSRIMNNKYFLTRQLGLLISGSGQYSQMTSISENLPTPITVPEMGNMGRVVRRAKNAALQLLPRQRLSAPRFYKALFGSLADPYGEFPGEDREAPCFSSTDSGIDADGDHYFTESTFNLNCTNSYFSSLGTGHVSDRNDSDSNVGAHIDIQNFSFLINYEGLDQHLSFTSFVGDFNETEGHLQFQKFKSQAGEGRVSSGLDCESLQLNFSKSNTSYSASYESRMCRSSTIICDSKVEVIKRNSVRVTMTPDSGRIDESAVDLPMQITMQVDGVMTLERQQDTSYSGLISLHLVEPSAACPSGIDSGSGLIRMDIENTTFEVRNCSCANQNGCDLYINGQRLDPSTMTVGNPTPPVTCDIRAKAFEMHPNAPGLSEDFYTIDYWQSEVSPMIPFDFDPYLIPITVDSRTLNNRVVTVDPTDETLGLVYPKLFLDGFTPISSYKMIGDGERTIDDYHLLSQVMAYYIPNRQAEKARAASGWYINLPLVIRPHCQQMLNAFYRLDGTGICMGYFGPLEYSFEGPIIAHEIGHVNFHWASRYIHEPSDNQVFVDQIVSCRTTHGCIRAIDEGQADFHAVLLFEQGDHLFDHTQIPGRSPARNRNLKCGNVEDLEVHAMGAIYAAIWWDILQLMGPDATAKLFYAHLPILSKDSTFVSALVAIQVVDTAIQDQYNSTDRRDHTALIGAAFRAHGITSDGCVVDE